MNAYNFQENTIYVGDCKDILRDFPDESADLIYLDPPFFSKRNYEVIWEDGAEMRAFQDRWKGGINQYIEWMENRVRHMKNTLKNTGVLCLHCDTHASHYLKTKLDHIFGKNNFLNEIIWCYKSGGVSKRWLKNNHETILCYKKSSNWTFNPQEIKEYYDEKPSLEDRKGGKDEGGYYHYVYMDDVWEISKVFNLSNEYLGYPTQKPLELLKRIIRIFSNEGDLVLDPFCGCGTTIAAAQELNRKWIGIDISPTACSVMRERLKEKEGINAPIIGIPNSPEGLKKLEHYDFQNWVVRAFQGRHREKKTADMGIDGYTNDGTPIQVKQSENVGRNVVDNFETAVRREKKEKGIVVAFSFSKGAWEERARARTEDGLDIELKKVEELFDELKRNGKTPSVMFADKIKDYQTTLENLGIGKK